MISLRLLLIALFAPAAGCAPNDHVGESPHAGHAHTHEARHGGATVELGEDEFRVEFTYGETPGTLQAYFFDGEMENYVRVSAASFAASVRAGGEEHTLVFNAAVDPATGETVGDTALFEASAGWLAAKPVLQISVPALSIKGRSYTNLSLTLAAGAGPPKPSLP